VNINWWRARAVASVTVVLAVLAVALLLGLRGDGTGDPGSDPPPSTTVPNVPNVELIGILTVDTTTVDCQQLLGEDATMKLEDGTAVIRFEVGALKPVRMDGRAWSDAISNPLKATLPAEALKEIQAAICQDPLMGVTVAHLFAGLGVEGVKVVDLNDWLKPYAVEAAQINDLAVGFIPLLDVAPPTEEQVASAISQNLEYQDLAESLGTLLGRFQVVGIQAEQSVLNYHLDAGGLAVGKLPEVGLNPAQENLPALVLEANVKPGNCLARVGFNVGDKRPEVFGCPPVNPPGGNIPGGSTSVPTTTPCGDKSSGRQADGTCGVAYTTVPRSGTTTPGSTSSPTVPGTAPKDSLPPGVTPTTWDVVPTPSTIQSPNSPPVSGTSPTTLAPPVTAPTATNTGTVPRP